MSVFKVKLFSTIDYSVYEVYLQFCFIQTIFFHLGKSIYCFMNGIALFAFSLEVVYLEQACLIVTILLT